MQFISSIEIDAGDRADVDGPAFVNAIVIHLDKQLQLDIRATRAETLIGILNNLREAAQQDIKELEGWLASQRTYQRR